MQNNLSLDALIPLDQAARKVLIQCKKQELLSNLTFCLGQEPPELANVMSILQGALFAKNGRLYVAHEHIDDSDCVKKLALLLAKHSSLVSDIICICELKPNSFARGSLGYTEVVSDGGALVTDEEIKLALKEKLTHDIVRVHLEEALELTDARDKIFGSGSRGSALRYLEALLESKHCVDNSPEWQEFVETQVEGSPIGAWVGAIFELRLDQLDLVNIPLNYFHIYPQLVGIAGDDGDLEAFISINAGIEEALSALYDVGQKLGITVQTDESF